MITNVLLVGVGGQGTITASQVLAEACLHQGWYVKKSEIHGMSQRGGSVESHVRFSPDQPVPSPTIPDGEVDVLLGFELLEALRSLPQVKPAGTVIADPRRIVPLTVTLGGATYPEDAVEQLQASGRRLIIVPAFDEAQKLGEVRAANIILLGAAARVLDLSLDVMEAAIRATVKPRAIDINLKAFARGVELAAV
ncbi:MAG: indolepyruvate oxidoreductase subunit beta [Armatimonadia bacterium]